MSFTAQRADARARPVLVCFSHLRWNFVFQRPQHLLSRAQRDYRVYFVEEPVFEAGAAPHLRTRATREGVDVVVPVLAEGTDPENVLTELRKLVELFVSGLERAPEIAWYYTPMALRFSRHLTFPVTVFDCMDELSHFKGAPPELRTLESELLAKADVVFTGGQSLYESKRRLHANVHAFPSSVDAAHFRPARNRMQALPQDLSDIEQPRIGYFGVIDERIDLELVGGLAGARPDWQIVMIGPVVKIDVATLPKRRNIHWLGMKAYDDLPVYLSGLDVGWMPFAINDATKFISPTKTPEFLAAGVPVVGTPVADVVRSWGGSGLVEIAAGVPETVASVEASIGRHGIAEWLQSVDRRLAATSWDETWRAMRTLIEEARLGSHGAVTIRPVARASPKNPGIVATDEAAEKRRSA